MRPGFVLFTAQGERVPVIRDNEGDGTIIRHGWKSVREWTPGWIARRGGSCWYLALVDRKHNEPIHGSVAQLRAWDWLPPIPRGSKRWPNIASIEVFLRTKYGAAA